jgi:hypothetical protein
MKYFIQLLDSYFQLHEQAPEQAVAGADQQAQKLISQAEGSQGNPVTVTGNITLRMSKNKNITLYGYGNRNHIVKNGDGSLNQDGYDILLKLLSGEIGGDTPQGAPQDGQGQAPVQQITPEQKYSELGFDAAKYHTKLGMPSFETWLTKKNARPPSDKNFLMKMIKTLFPSLSTDQIKQQLIEKTGGAYSLYKDFLSRFNGKGQTGSLAHMLANHVMMIDSSDGKQKLVKKSNEELISNSYATIEKMMVRLSNLVRDGKQIDPEECDKFKDTVIPLTGSKMYFNDRSTNTGIVINDARGDFRTMFDASLKAAGCELGASRAIGSIAGAAAQIRGAFSESVQRLIVEAANCTRLEAAEQSKCADKLNALFEDFKDKEDLLVQALQEYGKVLDGDGSIPVGEDNSPESLAYATLFERYGNRVPKVILRSLVNLARRSYMERQPDRVIPIDKDTKFGKKGDTLELWDNKEKFFKAMEQYGVSRESAEKHMVVVDGQFGADVSLKNYITLRDGVSLGSVSENTLRTLLSGEKCNVDKCTPEEIAEIKLLRQGMAASLDQPWMADTKSGRYKQLSELEGEISKADEAIDSLAEDAITTGADGKQINVKPLEKFVNSLSKQMKAEFSYSDLKKSGLIDKMESYLQSGKSPEQVKALMKNFLKTQILNKYKNSDDPNKQQTFRDHHLVSEFAAAGSRNPNTLISMNGVDGEDQFTGRQNDLLDAVKKFQSGDPNYSVETNIDGSEVTYYGPGPDGSRVALYSSSTTSATSGRRTRGSHVSYQTIQLLRSLRKGL